MIWLRSAVFNLWFYGITVVLAAAGGVVQLGPPAWSLVLARVWARAVLAGLRPLCGITSLILVTSGYHMDRARLELGRTLPGGVAVLPAPLLPQAADGHDRVPWRLWASEYAKWLGAAVGFSAWIMREEEGASLPLGGTRSGGNA